MINLLLFIYKCDIFQHLLQFQKATTYFIKNEETHDKIFFMNFVGEIVNNKCFARFVAIFRSFHETFNANIQIIIFFSMKVTVTLFPQN